MRALGIVLLAVCAALPAPARAQFADPATRPPPPANQPPADAPKAEATPSEPMEEIVIHGRQRDVPSFQQEYEFHKAEFEQLRKRFERAPQSDYSSAERKLRIPESVSSTVQGKPTLTERID